MMFFFKGRSMIVDSPARVAPNISTVEAARGQARAKAKLENADTSGAIHRDRQPVEDSPRP